MSMTPSSCTEATCAASSSSSSSASSKTTKISHPQQNINIVRDIFTFALSVRHRFFRSSHSSSSSSTSPSLHPPPLRTHLLDNTDPLLPSSTSSFIPSTPIAALDLALVSAPVTPPVILESFSNSSHTSTCVITTTKAISTDTSFNNNNNNNNNNINSSLPTCSKPPPSPTISIFKPTIDTTTNSKTNKNDNNNDEEKVNNNNIPPPPPPPILPIPLSPSPSPSPSSSSSSFSSSLSPDRKTSLKSPRAVLRALVPTDAVQSRRMDLLLLHETPKWSDLTRAAWKGCSDANRAHIWRLLVGYEPLNFSARQTILREKRKEYRHFVRALYAPLGRVRFDCSTPVCTAQVEDPEVYNVEQSHDGVVDDVDLVVGQRDEEEEEEEEKVDDGDGDGEKDKDKDGNKTDGDCGENSNTNEDHDQLAFGSHHNKEQVREDDYNNDNDNTANKVKKKCEYRSTSTFSADEEQDGRTTSLSMKKRVIEYSSFSAKTLRQIEMDLPRTHPLVPIFHVSEVRNPMRRILYIFGMLNPNNNYVQGMNEILSAILVVFLVERLGERERAKVLRQSYDIDGMNTENTITRRPRSLNQPFGNNNYVHNLSNTTTTICSFLKQSEIKGLLNEQELVDIEADAFWIFSEIISRIEDNFIADQPGILRRVARLEQIVIRVDPSLAKHLANNGNHFLQFAFRWMNCLLMRELPLHLTVKLWDALLAHDNGIADLHVYFCAALLTRFADELLQRDFEQAMLFLQNLPTDQWTEDDVDELLSQAFIWEQSLHFDSLAKVEQT